MEPVDSTEQKMKTKFDGGIAQNAIVFSDMYLQCPVFQCAE